MEYSKGKLIRLVTLSRWIAMRWNKRNESGQGRKGAVTQNLFQTVLTFRTMLTSPTPQNNTTERNQ